MIVGVLLLFGSVFPYIAVNGDSYDRATKVDLLCLP